MGSETKNAKIGEVTRNQGIEALRIPAAFGIVWFHSGTYGAQSAYVGLAIFLTLASYFAVGPNFARRESVNGLALKLLVPWAFWFLVFLAVNLLKNNPPFREGNGLLAGIAYGPSPHLWYLPYIFVILLLLEVLKRLLPILALGIMGAVVAIAMSLTVGVWRPWSVEVGFPVAQYVHAITPVALGVVLASVERGRLGWVMLAFVLAALIYAISVPLSDVSTPYLAALICVFAAIMAPRLPLPLPLPKVQAVSGLMFGVYLVHPLFLTAFRVITGGMLMVILAFVSSLIFVAAVARFAPGAASLLLGARIRPSRPLTSPS